MTRNWCEVSRRNLSHNLAQLRKLVGDDVRLMPVVKSNAYGHGLLMAAETFVGAGADWLAVDSLEEAVKLREGGLIVPIVVLGYILQADLKEVIPHELRPVVYNWSTLERLGALGRARGVEVPIHIKLETGCNRQGVSADEALHMATYAVQTEGLSFEGLTSHFADVEDTTDHTYAQRQLDVYMRAVEAIEQNGLSIPVRHFSNSAAVILWPRVHLDLVRAGISAYGMWPSKETLVAAVMAGRVPFELRPALTWKTRIAQIKRIDEGAYIGYGRSYQTTHTTRLAVLPVGYYDGYSRLLSNSAFVIIHGKRAPIRGRVCMNIILADVTNIPDVKVEDEVILLGRAGEQVVSAEMMADWSGTINYEVTTRIAEHVPRLAVE